MGGSNKQFGDYQTPFFFSEEVCDFLKNKKNVFPHTVIEPTCGIGNFLKSSIIFNADCYYGVEINKNHIKEARKNNEKAIIYDADFFKFDFSSFVNKKQTLVLGNPPWITNSNVSLINGTNVPNKVNFKHLNGLEAITGGGNFDICEYMILSLIKVFKNTDTRIAMLCKTSVARNIYLELFRQNIYVSEFEIFEFDAKKIFNVSVDACLLYIDLNIIDVLVTCKVYDFPHLNKIKKEITVNGGKLKSLSATEYDFSGQCCFEWRQGVKHDCSKIMELTLINGKFYNGLKEQVNIESDRIFPLVKSSSFKKPILSEFKKYVLITQKKVGENTSALEFKAPKTWAYLNAHLESFRKRKSIIYKNSPEFAMFGIGNYSFSKYKVGVSGFYKKPIFSVLYSVDDKPVMADDTCYFICMESFDDAYVTMLLLNCETVQDFLESISFKDSKRPYNKKVLEQIDFRKILNTVGINELKITEKELGLTSYVNEEHILHLKNFIVNNVYK